MKPETERLLQYCRSVLLQYDNERLNALFMSWFERMVGEEDMDEDLDDLCLLLGYGLRSTWSCVLYSTYTAWWEVEGFDDPDGEFECLDRAALQHHLITMPIKQFNLVSELAYQVCSRDTEGQSRPPTGQEWLRIFAAWLAGGAQEPFNKQDLRKDSPTTLPALQQQVTQKPHRSQQHKIENKLIDQAWQRGYLLLEPDVTNQVMTLVQSRCKKNCRLYISVQSLGSQFASIYVTMSTQSTIDGLF